MKRLLVVLAILAVPAASHASPPRHLALVTVESQNRLLVVDVRSGRVLRSMPMPPDPENVEAYAGQAAVVSTRAGVVTLLDSNTLRPQRVLRGFGSPHIAAFAPSGDYLYVTDDRRGQLAVILGKTVRRIFVGYGAHHMAFSPDQTELWIALGERARSIAVVDTRNPMRPRLEGNLDPHGLAHDLAFTPDGRFVWVAYDDRPYVRIFDAETKRPVAKLYAGTPPAHVRFDDASGLARFGSYAYVTSGNDATLRLFDWRSRRLVRVLTTSPGSFNLSVDRGVVATTSLTNGTMTVVRGERRVSSRRIAPATRDVALVP
jgi:DNA-binding beta-propeller fold protein YncE